MDREKRYASCWWKLAASLLIRVMVGAVVLFDLVGCDDGHGGPTVVDAAGQVDGSVDRCRDAASGVGDAAEGGVADASDGPDASGGFDAGEVVIVTPANASRTILPGCVDGVVFSGLLPDCMGDVGVGLGDLYAVQLNFKTVYQVQRLSGDFRFDETTRGAYNAAISEVPGSFDVAPGCKDETGFFPTILFLNQMELDALLAAHPELSEEDILNNHCRLDMSKTYYLNVEVVGSCRKDDASKPACWATILQQNYLFQF